MSTALAYLAAALVAGWGVAHVVPTRQVVAGFGGIATDNRRILVQEWWAEGIAMWALAAVVIVATAVGNGTPTADWMDRVVAAGLIGLALLTTLTGARTPSAWFKVCPLLQSATAIMLIVASFS